MFHPFSYAGPVRIPPPKMQLRVRKEANTYDTINARQFEAWQNATPIVQGGTIDDDPTHMKPVYYDMTPLMSRNDKQDYRQAQPFVATGPSLAMNPYFDRYDPTRDPRNMIREVRSVVYEEKEADRGLVESQRIVERGYLNRWITQGATDELKASLEAYEVMRPKVDNIEDIYKAKPVDFNTSILSSFNQT
ncbi:hypothetical protein EBR66_06305 [bacterium]|nr:hypothetical protein [bacterium]